MDGYLQEKRPGSESFQKLMLSSMSLLIGSSSVLLSMKVLKSEELQLDHYLGLLFKREGREFPIELLASALLTLTWGTGQCLFSLMFFFGEVGWRNWCWVNFGIFFVNSLCLLQLGQTGQHHLITIRSNCPTFHTVIYINTGFAMVSVLHSLLVISLNTKHLRSRNTRTYSYSD